MVRLETALYEKVVNRMTRATTLAAPKKWYNFNPHEHLRRTCSLNQSTTTTS